MMKILLATASLVAVAACATITGDSAEKASVVAAVDGAALDAALASQSAEVQARYAWRHPKETLTFIGVAPGMTVVDVLPGDDGYYSKILLPYLGPQGRVIGADYAVDMWRLFGSFVNDEFIAGKATWAESWTASASGWRKEDDASIDAFAYGFIPEKMMGTADVVLMIRAFHHFNRFEEEGGWRTKALQETMDLLKPGGIVGVVQHRAPESNSDKWAEGDNGYLKQSAVIAAFEAAGFEFIEASDINANAADQPTEQENVWRLPPSLGTSRKDPELRAKMQAIGESNRMTLKFRKPA